MARSWGRKEKPEPLWELPKLMRQDSGPAGTPGDGKSGKETVMERAALGSGHSLFLAYFLLGKYDYHFVSQFHYPWSRDNNSTSH